MEILISQPVKLPFTSVGLALGKTAFPDFKLVKNGLPYTLVTAPVYTELSGGVYSITLTPTETGEYYLFIEGSIQRTFSVVNKRTSDYLSNLEDEALGSWTWNKSTGLLTLHRQDGSTMSTFHVTDSLESGSRERLT